MVGLPARKSARSVRVLRQFERIYKTNLDWEPTLTKLKEISSVRIVEPGSRPRGIRYLYWKNTMCNFGCKGGLDIHSVSDEELEEFVLLLKSKGVYRNGESPLWELERSTHGKKWYKEKAAYYKRKYETMKLRYEPDARSTS